MKPIRSLLLDLRMMRKMVSGRPQPSQTLSTRNPVEVAATTPNINQVLSPQTNVFDVIYKEEKEDLKKGRKKTVKVVYKEMEISLLQN